MKKLFLLALLCIGFTVAKAQRLTINNNTGCDAFYILYGSSSVGSCATGYKSTTINIGAGASHDFTGPTDFASKHPPGMVSGGTTLNGGWFSSFHFPCNPSSCPGCSGGAVYVGHASCGAPSFASQAFLNAACVTSPCGTVNITYSIVYSGGSPHVTININ